jgi:DNA adenine methylase
MTNSSHKDIKKLYKDFKILKIPKGTSNVVGVLTNKSKEIIISNY